MEIEFIEVCQDWDNCTTTYWFTVDGWPYAVIESGPHKGIVDGHGDKVDLQLETNKELSVLFEEVKKYY